MHQNIFSRFKWLVLTACFDKKLFCEDHVNLLPDCLLNFLKMTIRVHTYEIAKSDTGTDERCKTPAKGTFSQFDHIGTSFAERRAFTDGRT